MESDPACVAVGEGLFASHDLRVWRVRRPSGLCVVTFGNYTDVPGLDRPGFAEDFLARHGIDAIHVVSRGNDWYQYPEMPAALAAIRAAAKDSTALFTYGSSMGGYAAIRYAAELGAVRAIALSPQSTLDPRLAPFEDRWQPEARRIRFLPEPPGLPAVPVTLFYDPHGPDRLHAQAIARRHAVTAVVLPYAGHPAGAFLVETGLLGPAILDVLGGQFDAAALMRDAHARRRRSGQYLSMLAGAQPASRRWLRVRLARLAVRTVPGSSHYASRLAGLLYRAGQFEEAERMHRHAIQIAPDTPLLLFRYSLFLQRMGRFEHAVRLARQAMAADPGSATLRRHLSHIERLSGASLLAGALRAWDAMVHRAVLTAWRRGWPLIGRIERP